MANGSEYCTDQSVSHHRGALLAIHFATVLLGFAGLFGKFIDATPVVIVAGRTLFAALAMLLAGSFFGLRLRLNSWRDLLILVASGALLTLHWFAFFHSIQISTVAIGLFGFASFPLFVTLLEPMWFDERLGWIDLVAVLIVTVGLALLAPAFDLQNQTTRGLIWAILSGFLYALFALLSRSGVRRYSQATVCFYQQLVCFSIALPLAIGQIQSLTSKNIALLAALGIVCTALAQILLLSSLKSLRAQTVSIIICLEPVYGIVFAYFMLQEIPTWRTLVGGGLILVAAVISTFHSGRRSPSVQV